MAFYTRWLRRISERIAVPVDHHSNAHWFDNPLASSPKADRETYLRLAQTAREKVYPQIDQLEAELGYAIDKEWLHELALHTQIVVKKSPLAYEHGRLLYAYLRRYLADHQPDIMTIIETGTARGFSSLCMAKALHEAGVNGRIVTFDVLPHTTKMYWNCIDDLDGQKTRAELLTPYAELTNRYLLFHQGSTRIELPKLHVDRINFAFLDAAHTYEAVLQEFAFVKSRQQPGDVIFFDDYTQSAFPGVVKAVDEVCATHNYEKRVIILSDSRGYAIGIKR